MLLFCSSVQLQAPTVDFSTIVFIDKGCLCRLLKSKVSVGCKADRFVMMLCMYGLGLGVKENEQLNAGKGCSQTSDVCFRFCMWSSPLCCNIQSSALPACCLSVCLGWCV